MLYSQTRNIEAIRRLFRIGHNRAAEIIPQPSIFPGYTGPVIRCAEDGERELVQTGHGELALNSIATVVKDHIARSEYKNDKVAIIVRDGRDTMISLAYMSLQSGGTASK